MSQDNIIAIKVLDSSYKIKCPPEGASDLQAAAQYVDAHMHKLRQLANPATSVDRIAVVTALNIGHELLQLQKNNHQLDTINQRIQSLQERIEKSLARMLLEQK